VVTRTEAVQLPPESTVRVGKVIVLKSANGSCSSLKNKLCSIYDQRPKGCQEYPWYNINGDLHYDSGCPGIRSDKDGRPDISTISPIDAYFPFLDWVRKLMIILLRVW